jgi:transketolase
MMTIKELEYKSKSYRKKILQYIYNAKAGHTGGCLSCIDILNVLYNQVLNVSPHNFADNTRDRYIQSKGHCVEALYVVLADKGFFEETELNNLCKYQSHYIGHPTKKVHGVEQNTGALGHGLPIAVGNAIAAQMDNNPSKIFTLLGDGELTEGSNWEAMFTAAKFKLNNLCAILDYNKLQITGAVSDVYHPEPLVQKLESFGWQVMEVNGNDITALVEVFNKLPFNNDKPNFIIAHTTKGKGVSFMENNVKWHHGVPNESEYNLALSEIENYNV